MPALIANNASSTLASGITDTATSITIDGGDAALFPSPTGSDWFPLTLNVGGNLEIMKCTARSGSTLTVVRAQEGTAALAASAGAKVSLRMTAAVMSEINSTLAGKEDSANKGAANGYAGLDSGGKVPAAQLPSYVDDVLEVANFAALPGTGEAGKIYVTLDNDKTWRWGGSSYTEISASPGSTDAVAEGSTNLYFTAARVRAAILTGYSVGTNAAIAATDSILQAFGKIQAQFNALGTIKTYDAATAAQFRANTATKALTTDQTWAAAAEVSLTDAGTIAVNMSNFLNAVVTLGGNRTLGNPTNQKVGQEGYIRIVQDGTGNRTLAFASYWKFAGNVTPTLSTSAGAEDILFYKVLTSTRIFASLAKNVP